jgi:HSP20 family molecular chaperone IbpA
MSIHDIQKMNARQVETLQRKNTREMTRIEQGHEELKSEMKKSNASDLVNLRNENTKQVNSENEKREKILEQMKEHLDNTQKMTDIRIKDLKENTSKVQKVEFDKVSANRERVKAEDEIHLDDLGHRLNTRQQKMVEDSQYHLEKTKEAKGQEFSETEGRLQTKLTKQNNDFSQRFKEDSLKQHVIKDDQDKQYKKERMSTHLRQEGEMDKLTTTHNKTLETRDKTFRKGIKEQDVVFEKKYGQTLNAHSENLKRLGDLNSKVLSKLKGDLSETIKSSVQRSDDPFYSFTELKPTLKQFEDRVEISVAIPEHAKTDVQLTMHGKEAIISFSRRYNDTRKEAGTSNTLNKVESFTTRLLTSHHLDPKSVKEKYDDGVMTYVIKGS